MVREREGQETWKNLGVAGRILLNGSSRNGIENVDGIDLAWDKDRVWALGNVAMNFQVPSNAGNFLTNF
jgi:hypothetical protein